MMQRFDANADGAIDSSEMSALPERMRDMFLGGDADGDGKLTREELAKAMQQMMERFQQGGGGPPGG